MSDAFCGVGAKAGPTDLDLTEAGRAVVRPWDERCAHIDEVMLSGFSDEEREQFASLLERARQNLTACRESEASRRA